MKTLWLKNTLTIFRELNNMDALQRAKLTLEKEYSVVGLLEKLDETFKVMEAYVPLYLNGIKHIYKRQGNFISFYSVRKLLWNNPGPAKKQGNPSLHPPPSAEAISVLKKTLKNDYELYQFAEQRLMKQLNSISNRENTQWGVEENKQHGSNLCLIFFLHSTKRQITIIIFLYVMLIQNIRIP
jgi:hypothetical protein